MTLINYAKGCAYSGHMFPQFYTFLFLWATKSETVENYHSVLSSCSTATIYNHLLFLFFNYKRYDDGNPWPILWFCMIGAINDF